MSILKGSLTALALVFAAAEAQATIVTQADPGVPTEIGARIRWGNTGFEASIFDNLPSLNQSPTLNPGGSPVWTVGVAYGFQITYDSTTGTLGLSIDFNGINGFEAGESITRSVFNGMTSYAGLGFTDLSISGNESGSTARSTITNLTINGDSQSSIAPGGAFTEIFYEDSTTNPITMITIAGDITYITAGTAQERPSWNFNLKGPAAPVEVPEPATLALLGAGLLGLGIARRRRAA